MAKNGSYLSGHPEIKKCNETPETGEIPWQQVEVLDMCQSTKSIITF